MMKKLLLLSIAVLAFTFSASAQMSKGFTYSEQNTIGLRLGYGVEASYQRTFGEATRLEADLGFMSNAFSIGAAYQWGWNIDKVEGLGWYVGPAANLFVNSDGVNVGIGGQVGLEYSFGIPLTLSLDWRPTVYFIDDPYFGWSGFAVSARYRF